MWREQENRVKMTGENSFTAICVVFRGKWSVVHASGFALDSPPPPYVNVLWTVWLSRPASVIASTSCSLDCCPHCVHDNHNIVPNPADVLQGPAQGNVPLEQSHNDRTEKKDSSSLWFWNTSDPAEHSAVPSVQMYLLLNRGRFGFSSSSIPLCASTWKPAFKIRATVGAVSYFTGTADSRDAFMCFLSFFTCLLRQRILNWPTVCTILHPGVELPRRSL